MYTYERENIFSLLDSMNELHGLLVGADAETAYGYLGSCQQAAITIGDFLDAHAEAETLETAEKMRAIVHVLEDYCEDLYQLTQKSAVEEPDINVLKEFVKRVRREVRELPLIYRAVFFPYKAAMWDSLESIYLAAAADPACEAIVVPIPYYNKDATTGQWVYQYEGASFPPDIPVVDYHEYNLSEERPDVAYIHNPYDEFNYVTSVEPSYYSHEIKKYVKKLVYVPYYATDGLLSEEHKDTSVTHFMDYAVLQSEAMRADVKDSHFYDKILPFGSPKFDRVIRMCREGVPVPEEWQKIIRGRRTLMLNTSINMFLRYNEYELDKLEAFFNLMKSYPDICLIWRPHPLYESTIRSMRPWLLDRYQKIRADYIASGIGVYDDTPDITKTLAIADAYIGAGASSVVNLFGVAGKPVFLFDDLMTEAVSEEERRIPAFAAFLHTPEGYFAPGWRQSMTYRLSLPEKDENENNIIHPLPVKDVPMGRLERHFTTLYGTPVEFDGKAYFPPVFADDAFSYDLATGEIQALSMKGRKHNIIFSAFATEKSVFFLPNNRYFMPEYVPEKREFIYHESVFDALYNGVQWDNHFGLLSGCASYKSTIFLSTGFSNRIAKIVSGTGRAELVLLGYSGLSTDFRPLVLGASEEGLWVEDGNPAAERCLWLAPWTTLSDISGWKKISVPDVSYIPLFQGDVYGAFGSLKICGKYMISYPWLAHKLLRIDRETLEVTSLAEDFLAPVGLNTNGYSPMYLGPMMGASYPQAGKILIQRTCDHRCAEVDIENGSVREFIPELTEEDYANIFNKACPFEKERKFSYFAMRESRFNTIQDFLDGMVKDGWADIRDRQLKALSTVGANLDGTCGQKTHDFMMNVLRKDKG